MPIKQNRIVVDTNLWISYLITKSFKRLDKLIYNNTVRLVFSQELIDEFIEVTKRDKFKQYFSYRWALKIHFFIFDSQKPQNPLNDFLKSNQMYNSFLKYCI